MKSDRMLTAAGLGALISILLLTFVIVLMGVGTFIIPSMVAHWKSQGLRELPVSYQILVDASDFCNHRWYIVLPILLISAVVLSVLAVQQRSPAKSAE